jgi:ribosomal protein S18 acetylase RimI-like enzyme
MAEIRPFATIDTDAIVALSLRAWEPVFASIREMLGADLDDEMHGPDWRAYQQRSVEATLASDAHSTWVADEAGAVVGFVALVMHPEDRMGEIYMIAVDPAHQGRGIGAALTSFAVERIADAGMTIAMVETGGDPGHAPARRSYERSGFTPLPAVRYFKKL